MDQKFCRDTRYTMIIKYVLFPSRLLNELKYVEMNWVLELMYHRPNLTPLDIRRIGLFSFLLFRTFSPSLGTHGSRVLTCEEETGERNFSKEKFF